MVLPEKYKAYLLTLKDRLQREGFSQSDFDDISKNELIFDIDLIKSINQEMRSFESFWSIDQKIKSYWPEDYLIIGSGGNGDYFCISKSESFPEVQLFEHECLIFSKYAISLDDFYQKTIQIMLPRKSERP